MYNWLPELLFSHKLKYDLRFKVRFYNNWNSFNRADNALP